MIWCFNQRTVFGYANDPSGATYKIGLTISSKKNGYLAKETIMIGPPAGGGGVLGMTSCYRVIKGPTS